MLESNVDRAAASQIRTEAWWSASLHHTEGVVAIGRLRIDVGHVVGDEGLDLGKLQLWVRPVTT